MAQRYLVIIGDVVDSRAIADRDGFQQRLRAVLDARNGEQPADMLASPYTLTLGDEFQVVRTRATGTFRDLIRLAAEIRPVRLRFALGLGGIATAINPAQAIGMDGPAFHLARTGIDRLREDRAQCRVDGPAVLPDALINHGLALAFSRLDSASGNRLPLVAGLLAGDSVAAIADRLGKAQQTLYKTIQSADLNDVTGFLSAVEATLDRAMESAGP